MEETRAVILKGMTVVAAGIVFLIGQWLFDQAHADDGVWVAILLMAAATIIVVAEVFPLVYNELKRSRKNA